MKISINIISLIIRFIFSIAIVVVLLFYYTTRNSLNETNTIAYRVKQQTQSFWQGSKYGMVISYEDRERTITISRATSDSIDAGVLPLLYHNRTFDTMVYDYHLDLSLKVAFVIAVLLLLSFLKRPKVGSPKVG